jgi:hypothetical protein
MPSELPRHEEEARHPAGFFFSCRSELAREGGLQAIFGVEL